MELFIAIQIDIVIQTIRVENEPLLTSEYVVSTSSTFDNWIYMWDMRRDNFSLHARDEKIFFMLFHNNTNNSSTHIFADDDYGGSERGMAQAMEE